MPPFVRQATPSDIPQLLPLIKAYWAFEGIEGYAKNKITVLLERLLGNPALGSGWLLYQNNIPIGYCLVCHVFSLEWGGLTAVLDEFFIVSEARGQGLGAVVLRQLEGHLRALGVVQLELEVGVRNDSARAFYRRFGFAQRSGFLPMTKKLA